MLASTGSCKLVFLVVCLLALSSAAFAVGVAEPNPSGLPNCPVADSRRLWPWNKRVGITNPALCTIGGLPYPPTTFAPGSTYPLPGGGEGTSYTIFKPTQTTSKSLTRFTPITTGVPTVVISSRTTTTTLAPSNTTTPAPSTSTSTTTTPASATGAGVRRAQQPTGLKSVQRFSGLQISLTLFLGLGVLAGLVYFLDELLDVLV